jgi:Copper type II ascorbate-dependent monooxygenase, C-terminal domain
MKSLDLLRSSLIVGGFLLALNACQKEESAPVVAEKASFELLQSRILTPTCATSGCHASEQDGSFKQHGLVLTETVSYDNLVNKDPKNPNALADKLKRVVPFYSFSSLLYHKLNWDGAGHHGNKDYGLPMPLGNTALSKGQLEFVRRWIEAGAPRTGSVVDASLLDDKTPSFVENFTPLPAPAATEGIQMKIEPFTIQPKFEREFFVRKNTGNANDLYVNRVQIKMRTGSHHFILYSYRDLKASYMPPFDQIRDLRNPDNSLNLLTALSMSNHIFWAGTQTSNYDYKLPEGTALLLPANYSLDLNAHNVNKTDAPTTGEVYANLYTIPKEKVVNVVQALDLANTSLQLPAGQKTVMTKSFTFPNAVKVLMLTSHTHQLGEKFVIKINGGARNGEVVYESTDWENPLIKTFDVPISLKKGEGFTSEITYNNTTKNTVKFGLTSQDEMGIIFGYYYNEK